MVDPDHEMLEACLQPFVDRLGAQASDVGRTLDLAWVPANPATPLIEHRGHVRVLVRRADRVPHLGVLGHQTKHHLFATAGDEDRHRPGWARLQLLDPARDSRQYLFEEPHPIARLAEPGAVPRVAPLGPARSETEP